METRLVEITRRRNHRLVSNFAGRAHEDAGGASVIGVETRIGRRGV